MSQAIVIRAEPGLSATLARCEEVGLPALGEPMFAVEPLAWDAPDPIGYDGVLLGSANAIRYGGDQLTALKSLPAYCVGDATADAVRESGFDIATVGGGGLQSLVDGLAGQSLNLLRLAGEKHVALLPAETVHLEQRIVYRSRALPMPGSVSEALALGGVVLLHSAEAAKHFASECDAKCLDRSTIDCALIGPRLADAVGTGWRSVSWPEKPDDDALVAFVRALWQTR